MNIEKNDIYSFVRTEGYFLKLSLEVLFLLLSFVFLTVVASSDSFAARYGGDVGASIIDMPYANYEKPSIHGNPVGNCLLTPSSSVESYPGAKRVVRSSRLAKPAGKSQYAYGQLIYIRGVIYDKDCVPLRDAKIEIWHTNPDGKYVFPDKGKLANPYRLFAGSGMTFSNNNGEYAFLSVFPGPYGRRAPHVNFRITSEYLKRPYTVTMYFANDARNEKDAKYRKIRPSFRERVEATVVPVDVNDPDTALIVTFDITVPARDPFRGYK